ncbi:MAG: FAD-dependent oxidoreductase [Bacteroidia bacterium]|nr:FAD-dependent oxidoreductase [Bacteroidia bacterium]
MNTRRTFIKTLGLAGLGSALGTDLMAAPFIGRSPHVLILGGGLAGLSAAYTLQKRGIPYTLLEAQTRVGGRVRTHTMRTGHQVELGAEWVGNSHSTLLTLCDELELPLIDNSLRTARLLQNSYTPPAEDIYSPDWTEKLNGLLKNFYGRREDEEYIRRFDSYDWYTYLRENGCPEPDLWKHELNDSTDFGENLRHVSAYAALAEYAENYGHIPTRNQMDKKIQGGNTRLAETLRSRVENAGTVLTGKLVKQVRYSNDEYTIYCESTARPGTESYTGTHIICTLPAPAVLKIGWEPGLSEEKSTALRSLQYARIQKHAFAFSEKFWEEDFSAVSDTCSHYIYHATKAQMPGSGALIAYSTGDKAELLHNQTEAYRRDMFLETLRPAFRERRRSLQEEARYYWGTDKYSYGAYAMYRPGQWFGIRETLWAPEGRIFFAGEHLADWQGFMEGALETGESAARMV